MRYRTGEKSECGDRISIGVTRGDPLFGTHSLSAKIQQQEQRQQQRGVQSRSKHLCAAVASQVGAEWICSGVVHR